MFLCAESLDLLLHPQLLDLQARQGVAVGTRSLVFVGDPDAPPVRRRRSLPLDSGHRMTLAESRKIDDVVLLRYLLTVRAAGAL